MSLKVTNISGYNLDTTVDQRLRAAVGSNYIRSDESVEIPETFRFNRTLIRWKDQSLVSLSIVGGEASSGEVPRRGQFHASQVAVTPDTNPFIQKINVQSFLNKVESSLSSSIEGLEIANTISFSGEDEKDFTLPRDSAAWIIRGRVFVADDPGGAFSQTPEIMMYSGPDRKDHEMIYKSTVQLSYTEFGSGATAGDSTITVDDTSDFFSDDLLYLFSASDNEFSRIDAIASATDLNLIDTIDNDYSVDDGVSNVVEFGNLAIIDKADDNKIYFKIKFDSVQTVDVRISLIVTSMISG